MNVKSQVATLQKIVSDPTQTSYLRGRASEIIRRYGLPIEEQQALALAEFHAYQEEIEKSRQLIAARKAATDPIIRDALQLAITKSQEQLLTKIKR